MTGPGHSGASASSALPFLSATTNLFVAAAGAGILSVPFAVKSQGIVLCLLWCVVAASLNAHCNLIVAQTTNLLQKHLKTATYDEVTLRGAAMHPSKGNVHLWHWVSWSILVGSVGTAVGFLVIVGNMAVAAITDFCGGDVSTGACAVVSQRAFVTFVFALIALPLSTTAKMHNLLIGSLIAALSVFLVGALVISKGAQAISERSATIASGEVKLFNWSSQLFLGVPITTFAFGNAIQVAAVMAETTKPVQRRFHLSVGISTALCYALYLLTGCMGYAAFGSATPGDILNAFSTGNAFSDVAKISMAVHVAMVLPVIILPAKRCFELMVVAMGVIADYHHNLYDDEQGEPMGAQRSGPWACLSSCFSGVLRRVFGAPCASRAGAMCGAFLFAGCGCCPCYKSALAKRSQGSRGKGQDKQKQRRHRADLAMRKPASISASTATAGPGLDEVAISGVGAAGTDETTKLLQPSSSGVIANATPSGAANADDSDSDSDSDSDEETDLLEGPALDLEELNRRLDVEDQQDPKAFGCCGLVCLRVRPYVHRLLWNACYLFACAAVAVVFPQVQVIFGLMGSTISVLQIFVAPACMLLFTAWRTEEAKKRYPHLFGNATKTLVVAPPSRMPSVSVSLLLSATSSGPSATTHAPILSYPRNSLSREPSSARIGMLSGLLANEHKGPSQDAAAADPAAAGTSPAATAFEREYRLHHATDSAMSLIRVQRDETTPTSATTTSNSVVDGAGGVGAEGDVGSYDRSSSFYAAVPASPKQQQQRQQPHRQTSSSKLEPLMESEVAQTAAPPHHHHVPSMATAVAPSTAAGEGFLADYDKQPWYTPKDPWWMKAQAYALLTIAAVLCLVGTAVNIREIVSSP